MISRIFCAAALSLSVFAVACGAAPEADEAAEAESDELSSAAPIGGSWTASDDATFQRAIVFNSDGTFFRDSTRILNGVLIGGNTSPFVRTAGRYTVNNRRHTITLNVSSPTRAVEKYSFAYSPATILNGIIVGPGGRPAIESLTLTPKAGGPAASFARATSWCTASADCANQSILHPMCVGDFACQANACAYHCGVRHVVN